MVFIGGKVRRGERYDDDDDDGDDDDDDGDDGDDAMKRILGTKCDLYFVGWDGLVRSCDFLLTRTPSKVIGDR